MSDFGWDKYGEDGEDVDQMKGKYLLSLPRNPNIFVADNILNDKLQHE